MQRESSEIVKSMVIPPPIMGWSTKQPISAMDPRYAADAQNFFSNGATVDKRRGYRYFAKNIYAAGGGSLRAANAIGELALQSGSRKFLALGGDLKPYNITAGGGSPTDLSSGGSRLVNSDATMVQYRNLLFIKDLGGNPTYYWDGAAGSVTAASFTGPGGGDTALANPMPYRNRLYFTASATASIWYSGTDAITGALTQFDVQSVLTQGGILRFVGGLTKTGDNTDNYLCIVSETGEVLLYQGSYPGDSTWSLVGHYYMPPPVGYRSFFYWGTNLVCITTQGVVLMSDVLKGDRNLTYLSEEINDQFIGSLVSNFPASSATMGVYYPSGNMLVINIDASPSIQFIMNTITGSWWKWTGILAYHWALFNNELYFASASIVGGGKVFKAWNGYFDEDPESEGNAISGSITPKLRHAFNYGGDTKNYKRFTEARPIFAGSRAAGAISVTSGVDTDYSNDTQTSAQSYTSGTSTEALYQNRIGLKGVGKACSYRIDGLTADTFKLQATEIFYTQGGAK